MARIPEYTAKVSIQPSDRGLNEFETAGRRIGGQYGEAAQRLSETARVKAATLADKSQWPFTLFDLQQKLTHKDSKTYTVGGAGPQPLPGQFYTDPNTISRASAPVSWDTGDTSLPPAVAQTNDLAAAAASLAGQMGGLIGAGDTTGGMTGPAPSATDEAAAAADQWASSIAGQPVSTGYTPPSDTGGGDATQGGGTADMGPSPIPDGYSGVF